MVARLIPQERQDTNAKPNQRGRQNGAKSVTLLQTFTENLACSFIDSTTMRLISKDAQESVNEECSVAKRAACLFSEFFGKVISAKHRAMGHGGVTG